MREENIRVLRHAVTGGLKYFDISQLSDLIVYNENIKGGWWTDDSELSESTSPDEDTLRAEITTLRAKYDDLEREQDAISAQIRTLAKLLPEDEQVKSIATPFD